MSMLRTIRLAVSRAIAPTTIITPPAKDDTMREAQARRAITSKQYVDEQLDYRGKAVGHTAKGFITTEDLADLNTPQARTAVASSAMWWCQMRLYNAIAKNDVKKQLKQIGAWADWAIAGGISTTNDTFLEKLAIAIDKLGNGRPAKTGNDDTDAVIARMSKLTVEELRAKRLAKEAKRVAEQAEYGSATYLALTSATSSGLTQQFEASRAADAIGNSASYLATWDMEPELLAGLLLDMEQDMLYCKKLAVDRNDETFVEGIMAADTICARYNDVDRDAELRTEDDADEVDEQPRAYRRIRQVSREELALDPLEILIAHEEQAA